MLTFIMHETHISYSLLNQYLNFLIQHDLVEDQTPHKKRHGAEAVYAITERGRIVLGYFKKLNTAFQVVEEAKKTTPLMHITRS